LDAVGGHLRCLLAGVGLIDIPEFDRVASRLQRGRPCLL